MQALKDKPKTSRLPHHPSPNCTLRNLSGFADKAVFVDSSQSQTRNAQNRMSFSDVQDSVLNTRNFTEYAYDAFGHRIETKEYLGDYTRNLYDGFSFDVLGKSVLQSAYSANIPAQKYRDGYVRQPEMPDRHPETSVRHPELVSGSASNGRNAFGSEIGTRYRYIDDTPLVPMTEAGKANGSNAASSASAAKTRSRPNNEYVLYSFGEPVAMTDDSGTSLSDLSFYESQAQLVGDFAEYYYAERYSSGVKYAWQKNDMKKMAEILNNSGYKTEAINWVLENY